MHFKPLAPLGDPNAIENELSAMPDAQTWLAHPSFLVGFANARDIPSLFSSIARERERVFRMHDEGSGEPTDQDQYDQTYVQLFVWDKQAKTLIGAYRLGQTDQLLTQGIQGIYLHQMFEFSDDFHRASAALELGRSFVVPEYQKNHFALHLLWQGIAYFLKCHPHYRRLYGTVSLSNTYSPEAIHYMCNTLIKTSSHHVSPKHALAGFVPCSTKAAIDLTELKRNVQALDHEHKALPILIKHYLKIGAEFLTVGVDPNFNNTPGLLLSVDLDALPSATKRRYFT